MFVLWYQPPQSDKINFVNALRNFISVEHKKFKQICILGDFNFAEISWEKDNYCCVTEADYIFALEKKNSKPRKNKHLVHDYKHADLSKIKSEIMLCDLYSIVSECNDVKSAWTEWQVKILGVGDSLLRWFESHLNDRI